MRDAITRRRTDLLVIGFLLILCTAPFADVLFGFRSIYIRDLTRYYYPTKRIIREVISHGEFPFWNRYYSAGQPMAANPEYEIFYPPQLLVLLPNYDFGYRLHILLHIWIATVGMYTFLRSLQLRAMAAAFGAIIFGAGGLVVSMVNLLPIFFCMVWMPLIFLFTRRFLLRSTVRDFALAAIFLGLQMLTAEPTTLIQTWLLMGLYALYQSWYGSSRVRAVAVNTGKVLLLGVSGALVGAAQLIPAIEHAKQSARSRPFDLALVSSWSMHPLRPLELIFPTIFGHVFRGGSMYWGSTFYPNTGSPFIFNMYFGVLGAAMLAAAFVVRPRGGRFVLALCAFSYVIALGSHTPLQKFLYDHHLASSIRYFEKFSLMGLFAATVFSAGMAQRCLDGDTRSLRAAKWFLVATTVVAAGFFIFCLTPWYAPAFRKIWGVADSVVGKRMIRLSTIDWGLAVARGLVAIVVVELVRRRRFGIAAACVTAALMVVDLSYVTYSTLPRMPRRFFTPPPDVRHLDPAAGRYRLFHEADWYNTTPVAKSYFSTGDAIYWIVRNGLFPMTPASWGFQTVLERDYDKTALLPTVDLTDVMWRVRDAGQKQWLDIFMGMSNARYRTEWRPLEVARKETRGNFKNASPIRFEDRGDSPRYFFARRMLVYRSLKDFEKQLVDGKWSRDTVFVGGGAFEPAGGTVSRAVETANTARIDVTTAGRAFLYMAVTPHKYWRVWIDGHETQPVVANVGYQGVVVPSAGHHVVTMRYRNTFVVKMATLSAIALLLFLGLALVPPPERIEGNGRSDLEPRDPLLSEEAAREAPPDAATSEALA